MSTPIRDKERVHHVYSLFSTKEFLAAIVGALIGGLFAVFAQFLSTLWQRKSERDAVRRRLCLRDKDAEKFN
jgi:hypothetical protein